MTRTKGRNKRASTANRRRPARGEHRTAGKGRGVGPTTRVKRAGGRAETAETADDAFDETKLSTRPGGKARKVRPLVLDEDVAPDLEVADVEAAGLDLPVEPASVDLPDDAEIDTEELVEEARVPTAAKSASRDEDVQSFLAMYFRDMAELDVLRPEEEFETAREIEALEISLWKIALGFPPATDWFIETVERAMEKPFPTFKAFRALATQVKPRARASVAKRFEKMVESVATELREVDIDRIFIDAVMAEVHRGLKVAGGDPGSAPINVSTKAFREFAQLAIAKQITIKRAKNAFVKANLRLVVSIARRFNHGRLPLADLIQEGNIGLMKAVERYDYRRGFRFSTYASWWIRHAISRGLADKGRAVRLPVHMIDAYHRIAKSERELQSKLEHPATNDEIAHAVGIEPEKLEKMRTFLNEAPVSLDRPISDDDGRRLIDVLEDPQDVLSAPDQLVVTETHTEMVKLLSLLKPIEADILRKRFGLTNDREQTLKEIGDEYRLSRERVRQLQEQALGKMRKALAKTENGSGA